MKVGQVGSDVVCQLLNLLIVLVPPGLEGEAVLRHLRDGELCVVAPLNLGDRGDDLAGVLQNPILTAIISVGLLTFFDLLLNGGLHLLGQGIQPSLNGNTSLYGRTKLNALLLFGVHLKDLVIFELKLDDTVEECLQVERDDIFVIRV